MLKGLKKGTKKETKDSTKKKDPKPTKKTVEEEEEEANTDLVDIDYEKEKQAEPKKVAPKKSQVGKLEEREIDTSNIVIEKKEVKETKVDSWIVEEKDIGKLTQKDFVFKEVETDFTSLTDDTLNKELEQKAKEKQKFQATDTVITGNGMKFNKLEGSDDRKDPEIRLATKAPTTSVNPIGIPTTSALNEPNFVNSNKSGGNFVPLERTKQDLMAEQIENRRRQEPQIVVTKKNTGWLGGSKKEEKAPEFKVSAWAADIDVAPGGGMKLAPLESDGKQAGSMRKEQQFSYTSKKEQEERKRLREEKEKGQAAQ